MMKAFVLSAALVLATFPGPGFAQRITEDDPRWDCRTMGNKICGPNAPKPTIYCGAPTKKGTACKRRVKKQGERCYQHRAKN